MNRRLFLPSLLAGLWLAVAALAAEGPASKKDPFQALALTRFDKLVPASEFTLPSPEGKQVSLADFKGKVLMINFWATWCLPCQWEMPEMESLYKKYKSTGFAIVAIALDKAPAKDIEAFVKQRGLTYPTAIDSKFETAMKYGVRGLPWTYFLDREGRIVAGGGGPREWNGEDAHALVELLLDKKG